MGSSSSLIRDKEDEDTFPSIDSVHTSDVLAASRTSHNASSDFDSDSEKEDNQEIGVPTGSDIAAFRLFMAMKNLEDKTLRKIKERQKRDRQEWQQLLSLLYNEKNSNKNDVQIRSGLGWKSR